MSFVVCMTTASYHLPVESCASTKSPMFRRDSKERNRVRRSDSVPFRVGGGGGVSPLVVSLISFGVVAFVDGVDLE